MIHCKFLDLFMLHMIICIFRDDELSTTCEELLLGEMGCTPVTPTLADHILKVVRLTASNSCTWKTKCSIIRFLQVHIFANIYVYKNGFVDRIREILDILLLDQQFEVRINAGLTLSGFIQCGLFTVDSNFLVSIFLLLLL